MELNMILTTLLIIATAWVPSSCDREHKVHNIVLYPERHSWCQTTPIKQIVAMPGYEPMTIDNNVCVGACYSYSIPRTQPAEPGELIGPYCDSCQPSETQCYHVTLQVSAQTTDRPKTIQKRVQIITNCSCSTCGKVQGGDCEIADQNTSELPTNLFSSLHSAANKTELPPEIPELLNVSPAKNPQTVSSPHIAEEHRYELTPKRINLLKTIQNDYDDDDDDDSGSSNNINYDRAQLKDLLDLIEGADHQLTDKNLMEFVNFVNVHNSADLELDLGRLKEVLVNFRAEQELEEKHRVFGLGVANNVAIENDLKRLSLPLNFGLEGSHHGLGHLKGSHIGMGIANSIEAGSSEEKGTKGHHQIGELQTIDEKPGHLVPGPHGSMIFLPDNAKVEEKLNLDSEEVRPNHEGAVISYENHHNHHQVHHAHHPQPGAGF